MKESKNAQAVRLFHEGENYYAYRYFGAHPETVKKKNGVRFRVWAPAAAAVSLVSDLNGWEVGKTPMAKNEDGIWEVFVPDVPLYTAYKYAITHADGSTTLKADPYAFHSETNGGTASKVYALENDFTWSDTKWMDARPQNASLIGQPVNIYEVHAGSWRRYPDDNVFSYRVLADELIPYVKNMGYTHIELMPITEYPFDASWGYQVTGYYSVTSRYGTPADFKYLINKAHKAGIGVIVDWVPAHFPKDEFGLARFDVTTLYEDPNPKRGEHKDWGTLIFDFGKAEIQSFLISSAMLLLDEYHIDGIRVDAVAAMLYLDYGRNDGEWQPNEHGGKENLQAIAFLQKLNHAIGVEKPGVITVAEESTAWPLVTKPPKDGGLGFHYKWNMGWMNDTLSYIETDPYFRKYQHEKLTFPLVYAFSENYILPISHDEVVYGKRSLLNKFPGEYEQKFSGLRAFMTFMLSQPGKKLLFMGSEFGQFSEWRYDHELDWMLLDYDAHRHMQEFVRDVNHFYLKQKPMWENDLGWEGFQWIVADDRDNNILAYRRIDRAGKELIFVINFAPVRRDNYCIGVPKKKSYKEIFNSESTVYGGSGIGNPDPVKAVKGQMHGQEQYISLTIPPLGAIVLR